MTRSPEHRTTNHPTQHRPDRPIVVPSRVRKWATSKGIEVGSRGRIPQTVVEQYRADRRAS